jgi:hypothetical protein
VADEDSLMALIRALRFQVNNLLEAPAQITQCEAIWKFLGCLTSEFVEQIWEHIDMGEAAAQILRSESMGTGSVTQTEAGGMKYTFNQVLEVAQLLCTLNTEHLEFHMELMDEMAVSSEAEGNSESEQMDVSTKFFSRPNIVQLNSRALLSTN